MGSIYTADRHYINCRSGKQGDLLFPDTNGSFLDALLTHVSNSPQCDEMKRMLPKYTHTHTHTQRSRTLVQLGILYTTHTGYGWLGGSGREGNWGFGLDGLDGGNT